MIDKISFMHSLVENKGVEKDAREGGMMFQVSEKASEMIKDYLKDKEANLTVRVMMHEGG